MTEKTKALFKAYEAAFDKLDVDAQVPYFAQHFIAAGPKGSVAHTRDGFAKMAQQAAQFYRSVGQTGAKLLSTSETQISNEYIRMDKDGKITGVTHVTYVRRQKK